MGLCEVSAEARGACPPVLMAPNELVRVVPNITY